MLLFYPAFLAGFFLFYCHADNTDDLNLQGLVWLVLKIRKSSVCLLLERIIWEYLFWIIYSITFRKLKHQIMEKDKKHTTIFYADDDADDLEFFIDATEGLEENTSVFNLGDKMLKVMENPPPAPSIIFLDLNMPFKSGFDVLKEIKASPTYGNIPVVILTTSSNDADIAKSKSMGARLYIRKPTSSNDLKKAIHFVLNIDWNAFNPSDSEFIYK